MTNFEKSTPEIVREIFDNYLPSWWRRDGTNDEVFTGLTNQISVFTQNLQEAFIQLSINTATGSDLDSFGRIFLLSRGIGETDASYRNKLLSFFSSFSKSGTALGIRETISIITGLPIDTVSVTDNGTALIFNVIIEINDSVDISLFNDIRGIIQNAKAAGTYNKDIGFTSSQSAFLINFSEVNGTDIIR